jgi:Pyruvate/2-oxoacid:ferredoxin oxidoreductase gamma subunit
MVMLGALLELTRTLPKESAFTLLKAKVRNAKLLEVDCQAIDAGIECLRKQKAAHPMEAQTQENELSHTR